MTTILCEALGFAYPSGVRALDGLTLRIAAGESVAIVGQNGSGKTTLVRHFNGLLRPLLGTVTIGSLDTRITRTARLARVVGLSFQDPDQQIFSRSVEAEVAFGPHNLGLRKQGLASAVTSALEAVGLAEHRATNPYDLGYSQRKLLAIASVLAMGTPVVVLDEPTTGQDARGVRQVQRLVAQLAGKGRTVIAVSHDLRFVAESFARVVVMREGRIVLDGSAADVFAERNWPVLRSTNLGPVHPAIVGARLGLGDTPTDASVVEALRRRDHEQQQQPVS